jgi:hypothetical protein
MVKNLVKYGKRKEDNHVKVRGFQITTLRTFSYKREGLDFFSAYASLKRRHLMNTLYNL